MKGSILCFVILLVMCNRSQGAADPSDRSTYCNIKSKVMSYGDTTKNWMVKHTIIVKDSVVNCITGENIYVNDMLYLAADGFTFGFVFDEERCKDIISRFPISGRIVAIGSRVIAVYIITKGVEQIIYYVIRHLAEGGVYIWLVDGQVVYVGRTNSFVRRATEWAKKGRIITPVYRTPFLMEQRIYEQMLIDSYGLPFLVNKINSIRP